MKPVNAAILISVILATGMGVGGYVLGNGLIRADQARRTVTVRGLAERDVVADVATWNLLFSASATTLEEAQSSVDRNAATIRQFLKGHGFEDHEIKTSKISVYERKDYDAGKSSVTINQTIQARSDKIDKMTMAYADSARLVREGVAITNDYRPVLDYSFTGLNAIKPEMIAAATKNARDAARQFARDSGARVGSIRNATQGYFTIEDRYGEGVNGAPTPNKNVRVVTTVSFYLTD